jgi:hypothetical protein
MHHLTDIDLPIFIFFVSRLYRLLKTICFVFKSYVTFLKSFRPIKKGPDQQNLFF